MSDYLFDPKAPPDADDRDVLELERQLGRFKLREVRPLPRRGLGPMLARLRAEPWRLVAAAVLLVTSGVAFWAATRVPRARNPEAPGGENVAASHFELEEIEGAVRVDSKIPRAAGEGALAEGDRVVCDAGASAKVRIGGIGWLALEEKTRVRVAESHGDADREGAYRLDLERGTVEASIFAAPRVFALGTPSAIAVDLGCRYRTTVDDAGHTTLAVTSGRVSFEFEGRKVHVPRGAACRAWPMFGPGTPTWEDADPGLRAAVDQLDDSRVCFDVAAARRALAVVLATQEPRDSLTLWHLLDLPDVAMRGEVYDKLTSLAKAPAEATREKCIARDATALAAWREELEQLW